MDVFRGRFPGSNPPNEFVQCNTCNGFWLLSCSWCLLIHWLAYGPPNRRLEVQIPGRAEICSEIPASSVNLPNMSTLTVNCWWWESDDKGKDWLHTLLCWG